ncbi:hypothetical protein MMC26_006440 [Xylographa opegraphella]|nr:hypothetical protein [Xylographa opegraphella]
MSVKISLATEADVKGLTSVFLKTQESDPLHGLIFNRGKTENDETQAGLFHLELLHTLGDSQSRIIKASLVSGGRIVGFGVIRFHSGQIAEYTPATSCPEEMNGELIQLRDNKITAMHRKHLNDQKHVEWQALFILPQFQSQAVGSQLLDWGFLHFGLAKEILWVQTPMSGRREYVKFGWKDVDFIDYDLIEWGGRNRGYGSYRIQIMIRKPGPLESITGHDEDEKAY